MFETMVDHGQKILAELGVEVGKVSSMEESVVVVVSSFFLEKYSAEKKTKQNKKRLDKSIGWVTNCPRYQARALVYWSSIHGTLSHSYLMKAFGVLVVSFRGINRKFRCNYGHTAIVKHTGIAKSHIV